MCGFAGFVESSREDLVLSRMLQKIRHRGPDGEGTHIESVSSWNVHLGHRRLSIIDVEGGKQPLSNETGDVWIAFNGEIFNFLELHESLVRRGHRFSTRSDTEVIVHHYEDKGIEGFRDLNGMFAFALWDRCQERLILARDRNSIKPLYYASLPGGGLAFCSELAALLEHPGVSRRLSRSALVNYLFMEHVLPPNAILDGVCKVAPGEAVIWEKGHLHKESFLLPKTHSTPAAVSEQAALEHVESLIEDSVKRQLIADVPVGVFLSGGIDSSLVAALVQKQSPRRILSFTIGFDDPRFDESRFARQIATHIGTEHIEETLREKDVLDAVLPALSALDEPLVDPSLIPTYLLSRLAARHVKVVLGGDGGDELFGGYPNYVAHNMAPWVGAWMPDFLRRSLLNPLLRNLRPSLKYQGLSWKLQRFFLRWDNDPWRRNLLWRSNLSLEDLSTLTGENTCPSILNHSESISKDVINGVMEQDFQYYLPSVLMKVDRASMTHGLEVRPPFLDNTLIEYVQSLPSFLKVNGKTTKYLLKKLAERWIPPEIVHRKKQGFAIPLLNWMRGPLAPLVEETLSPGSPLRSIEFIRRETLHRWWNETRSLAADHSRQLWSFVVLDQWMRRNRL